MPDATVSVLPPAPGPNHHRCNILFGSLHHDALSDKSSEWLPICTPSTSSPTGSTEAMAAGMVIVTAEPAGAHMPVLIHLLPPRGGMGPVYVPVYVTLRRRATGVEVAPAAGDPGKLPAGRGGKWSNTAWHNWMRSCG